MTTPRLVLAVGVLALVALIVFVQRPAGDADTDQPTATATSTPEETTAERAAPAVASDEDFCAGFRALAESQAQFAAGSADEALLYEAEALAAAAGVRLGRLLSLATTPDFSTLASNGWMQYGPFEQYARLMPSDVAVRVTVQARWELVR